MTLTNLQGLSAISKSSSISNGYRKRSQVSHLKESLFSAGCKLAVSCHVSLKLTWCARRPWRIVAEEVTAGRLNSSVYIPQIILGEQTQPGTQLLVTPASCAGKKRTALPARSGAVRCQRKLYPRPSAGWLRYSGLCSVHKIRGNIQYCMH